MPVETKSQRLNRQMKKDAERQARRRQRMAIARAPETHAVDRALSEALAYVAVQHHGTDIKRGDVMVPFREVLDVASRILNDRGRYELVPSMKAVVARTRPRKRMGWTLEAPSRPA